MEQPGFFELPVKIQQLIEKFAFNNREPIPILPNDVEKIIQRLINVGMLYKDEIDQ